MKHFFSLLLLLSMMACRGPEQATHLTYEVTPQTLDVIIPVVGELQAETETPISVPSDVTEPQVLAWLAEENTVLKQGDVVARLDPVKYSREVETQLLKQEQVMQALSSKNVVLRNERKDIAAELVLVDQEQTFAQKFAIDDLRVYSRNDIIDKLANVEYLGARRDYQQWRQGRQEVKSNGELELLQLEKQQSQTKLDIANKVLSRLEVTAPHDGVFVLVANWNGRKPTAGETMWPGRKFALIPKLDVMQARVLVLESDAFGLKEGLPVTLRLDAEPSFQLNGSITAVDSVASTREDNNPTKYFGVTVKLTQQFPEKLKPGVQVHGQILVLQKIDTLSVPAQSLQLVGDNQYLWIDDNGRVTKREVKVGQRSLTRVEIAEGLHAGERVLLQPPETMDAQ